MNLMNRMMSYDKTKINQENCNCRECVSSENVELKNQTVEYQKLSEEEIEQIINERYDCKDEKTKTFIRKALRKHGDRYDYSNVIYVKSKEEVEIICKVEGHKAFPQTPNHHLCGQGCNMCYGKIKLTKEEFIKKANKVHGEGTYDYSKVKYIDNKTDVIIICPKHEPFLQAPNNHLQGQGCPICRYMKSSEKLRMTKEEFIKRAREIHGDKYDYSKVIYFNNSTKVIITCPKHGDFKQIPNSHLNGNGCRKCQYEKLSNERRLTLNEFIQRANKIHNNKYNYSKVDYKDIYTKIIIVCMKHGDFSQTPNDHINNGSGCPKCNNYKGEIAVRKFLIEHDIEFEEQKRFENCRDKNPLPFDFYLPQYNLCIEYDGSQHFNPFAFHFKDISEKEKLENFKYIQNHDEIKNNYCKNNGISLLRLNNLKKVEEELVKYFKTTEL